MGSTVAAAGSLVGSLVLWFLWSEVAEEAAEAEHPHVRCAATSLARAVARGGGHAPQLSDAMESRLMRLIRHS